ncbi:MAG: hypothetical protein RL518_1860 [Pseudomonadota bacterium]|jgi:hypothetical protein
MDANKAERFDWRLIGVIFFVMLLYVDLVGFLFHESERMVRIA